MTMESVTGQMTGILEDLAGQLFAGVCDRHRPSLEAQKDALSHGPVMLAFSADLGRSIDERVKREAPVLHRAIVDAEREPSRDPLAFDHTIQRFYDASSAVFGDTRCPACGIGDQAWHEVLGRLAVVAEAHAVHCSHREFAPPATGVVAAAMRDCDRHRAWAESVGVRLADQQVLAVYGGTFFKLMKDATEVMVPAHVVGKARAVAVTREIMRRIAVADGCVGCTLGDPGYGKLLRAITTGVGTERAPLTGIDIVIDEQRGTFYPAPTAEEVITWLALSEVSLMVERLARNPRDCETHKAAALMRMGAILRQRFPSWSLALHALRGVYVEWLVERPAWVDLGLVPDFDSMIEVLIDAVAEELVAIAQQQG